MGSSDPAEGGTPYRSAVVMAVFAAVGVIVYMGHQGLAPATAIAGLLLAPFARPGRDGLVTWAAVGTLVAWGMVTASWSPATPSLHALHGLKGWGSFVALKLGLQALLYGAFVVAASDVSRGGGRTAITALIWAVGAMAAVQFADALAQGRLLEALHGLAGNPVRPGRLESRAALIGDPLSLLAWPVLAALWGRGAVAWTLAVAAALAAAKLLLSADAQLMAFGVGAVAFGLVYAFRRAALLGLLWAGWVYWLLTPLLLAMVEQRGGFAWLAARVGPSWTARLDIWRFVIGLIEVHPIAGWGLDASRTWPAHIPLHTHDAALQIWLELGVVGAMLATAVWSALVWLVSRMTDDRPLAAAAAAALCVYTGIGAVSFGVWQEWWLALGALTMAAFAVLRKSDLTREFGMGREPVPL